MMMLHVLIEFENVDYERTANVLAIFGSQDALVVWLENLTGQELSDRQISSLYGDNAPYGLFLREREFKAQESQLIS